MREVIPRCPGMLAAGMYNHFRLNRPHLIVFLAFMINSSWAHTGIWNVAKLVLHVDLDFQLIRLL